MLTYYKFSLKHDNGTATIGTWAPTEDDARQTIADIEKCPKHAPQLIQTKTYEERKAELI
jgi:hypothetical protein